VVRRPVTPRAAADTSAPISPRTWQYRRNARSEHAKYWPALADRPPDSSATTAAETSPGVITAGSPSGAQRARNRAAFDEYAPTVIGARPRSEHRNSVNSAISTAAASIGGAGGSGGIAPSPRR
jgi:hypothetical protein